MIMRRIREDVTWRAILCAALVLALGILFLFDPAIYAFYPVCWLHKLTGLYCPACGSLRAMHHLLHGQAAVAFGCNPLLVLSAPLVFVFCFVKWLSRGDGLARRQSGQRRPGLYWVLLLVLVIFGILRNLPFSEFAWMSP